MMAYLTRPPRSEQQEASGERVQLAAGTSLKYMIDFILRNARKVTKKVPSKQFLEKMAEANPQNIVNAYEDVKKRAGIIDDPDVLIGQAPKTDLEKIRAKAKKDKESIQQLADDNQIPVKDETIVPEDVITVPEPFKEKYQQEFLAHDALYGRRSGDNKVDAEAIAETVADMQGKVYDDLGYTERMDLYDKAYGYLSLLDRTKDAMKEKVGRTLNADGGIVEDIDYEKYRKTIEQIKKDRPKRTGSAGSTPLFSNNKKFQKIVKELANKNIPIKEAAKNLGVSHDVIEKARIEIGLSKRSDVGGYSYLDDPKNIKYIKDNYGDKKQSTMASELFPDSPQTTSVRRIERLIEKHVPEKIGFSKEAQGDPTEAKEKRKKQMQSRDKKLSKTSDINLEKDLKKLKKGMGVDLAHLQRKTLPQTTSNIGMDIPASNRGAIEVVEKIISNLESTNKKFYDKYKNKKMPKDVIDKIELNNQKIIDLVYKSKGAVVGNILNEKTGKTQEYIGSYRYSADDGLFNLPMKEIAKDPKKLQDFKAMAFSKAQEVAKLKGKTVEELYPDLLKDPQIKTRTEQILKEKNLVPTKLYSGFSPELGKLSYEVLKDVVKGIPTPLGAVGLTAATGGIDPTSAIDRTALGAELAFAPELVRQSAKFGPTAQRILNLGLSPKMAMRAARFASPVGIATLGAEGAYQLYQALENEKARIAAMSPEERQRFEEEQTAAAYMGEAEGYAYGGRVGLEEGGPSDPGRRKFFKIMGGLASLPILGKIAKPIAKAGPEAVEVISRTAEQMPVYLTTLINKVKNFGKSKVLGKPDSPDGAMEYNLGDYTVIEGPGYTRVNKSNYSGFGDEVGIRNEIEMEIKKDPETGVIQYEEIEVYPDMDGKMRDVEEGVDDMFHEEMEKFARSDD